MKNAMVKSLSLPELISENDFILLDVCRILPYRKRERKWGSESILEEIKYRNECIDYLQELEKLIFDESNIYVTRSTLEMKQQRYYHFKKNTRGKPKDRLILDVRRARRSERKECRKLMDRFENYGNVLAFNEEEQRLYDELSKKYKILKTEYELDNGNLDLLISGMTIGQLRNSLALVSNDPKIISAWSQLVRAKAISQEQMRLFISPASLQFEELTYPKR